MQGTFKQDPFYSPVHDKIQKKKLKGETLNFSDNDLYGQNPLKLKDPVVDLNKEFQADKQLIKKPFKWDANHNHSISMISPPDHNAYHNNYQNQAPVGYNQPAQAPIQQNIRAPIEPPMQRFHKVANPIPEPFTAPIKPQTQPLALNNKYAREVNQLSPNERVSFPIITNEVQNSGKKNKGKVEYQDEYNYMLNQKKAALLHEHTQPELRHLEDLMGGQENFVYHYNLTPSEYKQAVGDINPKPPLKQVHIKNDVQVRTYKVETPQRIVSYRQPSPGRIIYEPIQVYREQTTPVRTVTYNQPVQRVASPNRILSQHYSPVEYYPARQASPNRILSQHYTPSESYPVRPMTPKRVINEAPIRISSPRRETMAIPQVTTHHARVKSYNALPPVYTASTALNRQPLLNAQNRSPSPDYMQGARRMAQPQYSQPQIQSQYLQHSPRRVQQVATKSHYQTEQPLRVIGDGVRPPIQLGPGQLKNQIFANEGMYYSNFVSPGRLNNQIIEGYRQSHDSERTSSRGILKDSMYSIVSPRRKNVRWN